jgi:Aerobic-type carbon monoxide dehydrogenase, large subunit CoxL/CutL homologs
MRRLDVLPLLLGKGNYADDLKFSGYYGAFVRSQIPHGRIRSIDVSGATKRVPWF